MKHLLLVLMLLVATAARADWNVAIWVPSGTTCWKPAWDQQDPPPIPVPVMVATQNGENLAVLRATIEFDSYYWTCVGVRLGSDAPTGAALAAWTINSPYMIPPTLCSPAGDSNALALVMTQTLGPYIQGELGQEIVVFDMKPIYGHWGATPVQLACSHDRTDASSGVGTYYGYGVANTYIGQACRKIKNANCASVPPCPDGGDPWTLDCPKCPPQNEELKPMALQGIPWTNLKGLYR